MQAIVRLLVELRNAYVVKRYAVHWHSRGVLSDWLRIEKGFPPLGKVEFTRSSPVKDRLAGALVCIVYRSGVKRRQLAAVSKRFCR